MEELNLVATHLGLIHHHVWMVKSQVETGEIRVLSRHQITLDSIFGTPK